MITNSETKFFPVRAMRICFCLPAYYSKPIGGYRVVYEYANFLAARGHAVTIAFPEYGPQARPPMSLRNTVRNWIWMSQTRIQHRPLIGWHKLLPQVKLALVPALQDQFLPDGDVVIATAWRTAPMIAVLSKEKGRRFYLIQHHEIWDGPEDEVNATWLLPLRKIVISKWLYEIGHRMGASDLRHIPNGIDFAKFQIINSPETRPLSILTLNHDIPFKGVSDALIALTTYHSHYPDVPISMFGVDPRRPNIPDWINYVANPSQQYLVEKLYNENAIYLAASLSEGWGLPPAEAMACGCAFVGTDIGGFRDYATHNETALLSPPRDSEALFRNLLQISENIELRHRIQRSGSDTIRKFTWEAAGKALELYLTEGM